MTHDDDMHPPDRSPRERADAVACAEIRELLAGAVEHPLEPPQRSHVDAHLATCGPCRAMASWLAGLDAAASRAVPPPPPSQRWVEQLRARVMDDILREAAPSAGPASDSPLREGARAGRAAGRRGLWPAWPEFLRTPRALATLAVVALVGIFTYAEIRDRAVGTPKALRTVAADQVGTDADVAAAPAAVEPLAASSPAATPAQQVGSALPAAEHTESVTAPAARLPAGETPEVGRLRPLQEVAIAPPPGTAAPDEAAQAPVVKAEAGAREFSEPTRRPPDFADARRQLAQKRDVAAAGAARPEGDMAHAGTSASTAGAPLAAPVAAPTEGHEEATASFDRRTSEALADAAEASDASPWDEERARGAIGLVMEPRPQRDVEAAVGELLLALEDAPRPTREFARLARRQPIPAPATVRLPEPSSAGGDRSDPALQQFGARSGALRKDSTSQPAAQITAPAWSSLAASAAATSLADSAAATLLLRLPELPDGPVREQVVRWLRANGLR